METTVKRGIAAEPITIRDKRTGQVYSFPSKGKMRTFLDCTPATVSKFVKGMATLNAKYEILTISGEKYIPTEESLNKKRKNPECKLFKTLVVQNLFTGHTYPFTNLRDLTTFLGVTAPTARKFVDGEGKMTSMYKVISRT